MGGRFDRFELSSWGGSPDAAVLQRDGDARARATLPTHGRVRRLGLRFVIATLLACGPLATGAIADVPAIPASTVGMTVRIEQLVLPGSELEPVPLTDKSPVVIRIDAVYPHGSAFRYDLTIYGLEPGEHDLRRFLRRKEGTPVEALPELKFKVDSLLPPGQIEPHEPSRGVLPWLGGYRLLFAAGCTVWLVGLIWLLWPRRKRLASAHIDEAAIPVTLADRLRPLVQEAIAGEAAPAKLAELERALVSYWRRRLHLESLPPGEALAQLRTHNEASPLITQLEVWLHRPAGREQIDVGSLLEPYKHVKPEELELVSVSPLAGAAR